MKKTISRPKFIKLLRKYGACRPGVKRFIEACPPGGDVERIIRRWWKNDYWTPTGKYYYWLETVVWRAGYGISVDSVLTWVKSECEKL